MGMDLLGVSPATEEGEYFRANVWSWRPLWELTLQYCVDLLDEQDVEGGYCNDGYEITDTKAKKIAHRLHVGLTDGGVDLFIQQFRQRQADLPLETCEQCNGAGIRTDSIGVSHGMPDRALDDLAVMTLGRTHGWCNGCEGHGMRASILTWYHLDTNFVEQFADFCADSGGFTIC